MTDSPLEPLDLLDTHYADILAHSSHPAFELQLIRFGVDTAEARIKTNFLTSRVPKTRDSRTVGGFNRSVGRGFRVYTKRSRFLINCRVAVGTRSGIIDDG